ncbi:MAG TPA: flagellar motor protein MotB [Bryobacteraceae bacterium]|nr:flagellar motor protein MotB [Bryobacteraceae bacterium]
MPTKETAPIIIIKKKAAAHGHHGGAWKVAYADFVTAMMALFIVLWLMNTSENVKKMVGGYFQDPRSKGRLTGTEYGGSGVGIPVKKDDLPKLRQKLEQAMKKVEDFSKIHKQVQMIITPEGLRVELMETQGGFFFKNGSPAATTDGKALLAALAKEIAKVPNHVLIEGYTDAAPYHSDKDYSNWELSVDRANAARRLMEEAGMRHDQVSYVRGFADRQLKDPANPLDPANRRVSLIVQYQDAQPGSTDAHEQTSKAKSTKPI